MVGCANDDTNAVDVATDAMSGNSFTSQPSLSAVVTAFKSSQFDTGVNQVELQIKHDNTVLIKVLSVSNVSRKDGMRDANIDQSLQRVVKVKDEKVWCRSPRHEHGDGGDGAREWQDQVAAWRRSTTWYAVT
jgi:pyruvate carboxylase